MTKRESMYDETGVPWGAASPKKESTPRESNEQHTIGGILARLADACQCEPDIGLFYCGACKDAEVIERTLAELREYASHKDYGYSDGRGFTNCKALLNGDAACDCGLTAILARLDGSKL